MEKNLNAASSLTLNGGWGSTNQCLSNVLCKINDYRMQGVVDTGVSFCGVNPLIAGKLNVHVETILRSHLTTGDGSAIVAVGKFSAVIGVRGNNYPTEILVIEGLRDILLLGKDFCIKAQLIHSGVSSEPATKEETPNQVWLPPANKQQQVCQFAVTPQVQDPGSQLFQNSVTKPGPVIHVFQSSLSTNKRAFSVSIIPPNVMIPCNCPYVQLQPCRCEIAGRCARCRLSHNVEMDYLTVEEARRIREKIRWKLNLKRRPKRKRKDLDNPNKEPLGVPATNVVIQKNSTAVAENRKFQQRQQTPHLIAALQNSQIKALNDLPGESK